MKSRDYRIQAWDMLKNKGYWMFVLITIIFSALSGASSIVLFLVIGALEVGHSLVFLNGFRGEDPKIETLLVPFDKNFFNSLLAWLLKSIFIFFWSLLFIIPGIIKSYSYSMSKYILADNPEIDGHESIRQSVKLMKGNKWRLFCLHFSFIGWHILSIFTLGVGFVLLAPYIAAAETRFYLDLINENVNISDEIEIVEL